ncbi:hypothetical protein A2U01_0021277 [Trifolium medium]|uniref:Uncharacterized protein n=1 Tax=Trifolium medium TaxID=97028 RepID=A0A392NLZ5_9FABA|nr:hypothetical protein [Trifolium medium]
MFPGGGYDLRWKYFLVAAAMMARSDSSRQWRSYQKSGNYYYISNLLKLGSRILMGQVTEDQKKL